MTDNPETTKIVAEVLDPEDGEAGIVKVFSGRVLARFATIKGARKALKADPDRYAARMRANV